MSQSFRSEVLDQLCEMGSDISLPHSFDFYLYVPSEDAVREAAEKVRESKFTAEVLRGASDDNWLCRASITLVPEVAALDQIGRFFEQIAAALDGEFDGWESDVNRHQLVADALAQLVQHLDAVLNPWGFSFVSGGVRMSHCGPFACGHYVRGATRIGISCRETLDNLYYEHAFVRQHAYCRETESFTMGHHMLMKALGHENDSRLIEIHEIPDAIAARDGGDRVAAFLHDLTEITAPVLREPNERFDAIMRRGSRGYLVAWSGGNASSRA